MSTFVPVHDSIWTHRKTLVLAAALELPTMVAAAHMIHLWHWAVENAPDGCLHDLPAHVLATAAGFTGDSTRFATALVSSGFVDPGGYLHNWFERNGRLIEKRREKRDYMRRRRAEDTAASVPTMRAPEPAASVDAEAPRGDHVDGTYRARSAEENSREQYSTEENSTAQEPVVVVPSRARVTKPDYDDDDRPTYESNILQTIEAEEPELLDLLLGPLPCCDLDDRILLARLIWAYPLVDLIHEAQRMRARYKRSPVSWPCAFDDWLREGRTVRFLDGRMDQARHGTRRYLPEEVEEQEWEADPPPDYVQQVKVRETASP